MVIYIDKYKYDIILIDSFSVLFYCFGCLEDNL
jgi:hypothetical protein